MSTLEVGMLPRGEVIDLGLASKPCTTVHVTRTGVEVPRPGHLIWAEDHRVVLCLACARVRWPGVFGRDA